MPGSEADAVLDAALSTLEARLTTVPALRRLAAPWIEQRRQRFAHAGFVPVFAAPRWVPLALGKPLDAELDRELTYSTLAGYLFARLVDDVMDDQYDGVHRLVPALAFFDAEFHRIYRKLFPAEHPFWQVFESGWIGSFDAAAEDAAASIDSAAAFEAVAAKKLSAIRIPVAAACYLHDSPSTLGAWLVVCDRLCSLYQFGDDLSDWPDDLASGRGSWLISEARREASGNVAAWLLTEGNAWALDRLETLTRRAIDAADEVDSAHAADHARRINSALQRRLREMQPTYDRLAALADSMHSA